MSKQDDELGSQLLQELLEQMIPGWGKEFDGWPEYLPREVYRCSIGSADEREEVRPFHKDEPEYWVVRYGRAVAVIRFNWSDNSTVLWSEELATVDDAVKTFQKVYATECAAAKDRVKTRS